MRSWAQGLAGEQALFHIISPSTRQGWGQERGAAQRQKKGAPRANFHLTAAHLMSCEVEFTHAVSPLPHTGKGAGCSPCTHTAPAPAEHASIPQHPGIQRGMRHPHPTPLAGKKRAWVWSPPHVSALNEAKAWLPCFAPCTETVCASPLNACLV